MRRPPRCRSLVGSCAILATVVFSTALLHELRVASAYCLSSPTTTTALLHATAVRQQRRKRWMLEGSVDTAAWHVGEDERRRQRRATTPTRLAASTLSSDSSSSSTFDDDDGDNNAANSESSAGASTTAGVMEASRYKRLKDLMWMREALEDLTAAEFACYVEGNEDDEETEDETTTATKRRRKRAVDYEKLLNQLNRRVRDFGCEGDLKQTNSPFSCAVQPGVGMGSSIFSDSQRADLLERLLRTRQTLIEVIKGRELELEREQQEQQDDESSTPFSIALPEIRVEIPKEDDAGSSEPKLYVRDDGTVDWDGALQDQAALRKFGTAVWARINGRDPETLEQEQENGGAAPAAASSHAEKPKEVTVKIEETPQIKEAASRLRILKSELAQMEASHTALLSSALSAGQAVANVNLATLDPGKRSAIRASVEELELMKEKVVFQCLELELERIYTYLVGEVGNPASNGYIPLQDRLNVAEFGLLESQIDSFNRLFQSEEDSVDADVLAVVMEQVTEFKRRLGIDYYVTGFSFDGDAIRQWSADLLVQLKKSVAFYVKGVRLFWNDIVFCLSLINRAAQGYTLKPREVRTLRRTIKDIVTFIPVMIILLIPLSPVGHVLVFGAIQRFFPDFFPSCFTEQRQNLLQLYENAEYSEFTIEENWKEKLARLSAAVAYFVMTTSRAIYKKLFLAATTQTTTTTKANGSTEDGQIAATKVNGISAEDMLPEATKVNGISAEDMPDDDITAKKNKDDWTLPNQ